MPFMYFTTSNFFISLQKIKLPPVSVSTEEKSTILSMLYPKSRAKQMNPKKKYVCAVCKSSCDLYGLFNHMKQVRNKNIVLFPYNTFLVSQYGEYFEILYTEFVK